MKFKHSLAIFIASLGIMIPLPLFVGFLNAWIVFPFWAAAACALFGVFTDYDK